MLMGVVPMLGAGVAWWQRAGVPGRKTARAASPRHGQRPAELDDQRLIAELGQRFIALQAAWDACDVPALRDMTTEPMLRELCLQFPAPSERANFTQVLTLEAEIIGFDRLPSGCVASVAFSGLMRESAEVGASPFRELWMLTRSNADGAAWRLARQQTLL
jgi:predicted lipid-binding transport protein (Tim44 family)